MNIQIIDELLNKARSYPKVEGYLRDLDKKRIDEGKDVPVTKRETAVRIADENAAKKLESQGKSMNESLVKSIDALLEKAQYADSYILLSDSDEEAKKKKKPTPKADGHTLGCDPNDKRGSDREMVRIKVKELSNKDEGLILVRSIDALIEKAVYGVGTRGGKAHFQGTHKDTPAHGKVSTPKLSEARKKEITEGARKKAHTQATSTGLYSTASKLERSLDERTADLVKALHSHPGKSFSEAIEINAKKDLDRIAKRESDPKDPYYKKYSGHPATGDVRTGSKSLDSDLVKSRRGSSQDDDAGVNEKIDRESEEYERKLAYRKKAADGPKVSERPEVSEWSRDNYKDLDYQKKSLDSDLVKDTAGQRQRAKQIREAAAKVDKEMNYGKPIPVARDHKEDFGLKKKSLDSDLEKANKLITPKEFEKEKSQLARKHGLIRSPEKHEMIRVTHAHEIKDVYGKPTGKNKSLDERTCDLVKDMSTEREQEIHSAISKVRMIKEDIPGAERMDAKNDDVTRAVRTHNNIAAIRTQKSICDTWLTESPFISKGARVEVQGGKPATLVKDDSEDEDSGAE